MNGLKQLILACSLSFNVARVLFKSCSLLVMKGLYIHVNVTQL